MLAETGIIGFLFSFQFFLYFFKLIKKFFLNFFFNDNYDEKSYLCFGIIIWLWPLAPSFNFFGNWINVINYVHRFCFIGPSIKKKMSIIVLAVPGLGQNFIKFPLEIKKKL